jgi:hypothetical protein
MNPENNPYQLKPPEKLVREELKLVQIREDSIRPPASIGTDSFQGLLFGAPSLQPSKDTEESKGGSIGGALLLLIFLVPLVLAIKFYFFP